MAKLRLASHILIHFKLDYQGAWPSLLYNIIYYMLYLFTCVHTGKLLLLLREIIIIFYYNQYNNDRIIIIKKKIKLKKKKLFLWIVETKKNVFFFESKIKVFTSLYFFLFLFFVLFCLFWIRYIYFKFKLDYIFFSIESQINK